MNFLEVCDKRILRKAIVKKIFSLAKMIIIHQGRKVIE